VGVHGAAVDVLGVAPDGGEQARAGLHPPLALEQHLEQAKLGGGERDLPVADLDPVRIGVEPDGPGLEGRRLIGAGRVAAQHRLDAQHDFTRAEGLGDVIVGAELEADDAVDLLALRGEHDQGDARGRRIALEHPRQLETVEAR